MTPLLNSLQPLAGNEAAIGAVSQPKANVMPITRTDTIRALNDTFRHTLVMGGQCVLTHGLLSMGQAFVANALSGVRQFSDFNPDNDPYGEHDFGMISVADTSCIWKIDYYDTTLNFGSEDPADPMQTKRVLTIMLAEEY